MNIQMSHHFLESNIKIDSVSTVLNESKKRKLKKGRRSNSVKKWWDDDGDGIGWEPGEVSGSFNKKPKVAKEEYSDWRSDLSEILTIFEKERNDQKITDKEVNNKIKINPNLGESVESLGGTLLEITEHTVDSDHNCVLSEMLNIELLYLTDDVLYETVENYLIESIEEGYDLNDTYNDLIIAIDNSLLRLNEATVTSSDNRDDSERKKGILGHLKSFAKSAYKNIVKGVGYGAGLARRIYKGTGEQLRGSYHRGRYGSSGGYRYHDDDDDDDYRPSRRSTSRTSARTSSTRTPTKITQSARDYDYAGRIRSDKVPVPGASRVTTGAGRTPSSTSRVTTGAASTPSSRTTPPSTSRVTTGAASTPSSRTTPPSTSRVTTGAASTPSSRTTVSQSAAQSLRQGMQGTRRTSTTTPTPTPTQTSTTASPSSSSARTQAIKNLKGRRSERTRRLGVVQGRAKLNRLLGDIRNEPSSVTPSASPSASPSSSSARTQAIKNLKGRRSERTRRLGVVQGRAKLNRLLGDIRNEPSSVSESKLSADEKKTKEYYVKRMKSKLPEFEKRYPGRGKEVLHATATKMAQKINEQKSNNSAINQVLTAKQEVAKSEAKLARAQRSASQKGVNLDSVSS